jgi:hypothetical protein
VRRVCELSLLTFAEPIARHRRLAAGEVNLEHLLAFDIRAVCSSWSVATICFVRTSTTSPVDG